MKQHIFLIIFLAWSLVQAESFMDDEDGMYESLGGPCYMNIWPKEPKDSYRITNNKMLGCPSAQISWAYPVGELIIQFKKDAQASRPFMFCLRDPLDQFKYVQLY